MSGLVEPLGRIMGQLVGGGGANKIDIAALLAELDALSAAYPFQIPPFFALIVRTFSVIEGIALEVDPNYSIVRECFPYLSRWVYGHACMLGVMGHLGPISMILGVCNRQVWSCFSILCPAPTVQTGVCCPTTA